MGDRTFGNKVYKIDNLKQINKKKQTNKNRSTIQNRDNEGCSGGQYFRIELDSLSKYKLGLEPELTEYKNQVG